MFPTIDIDPEAAASVLDELGDAVRKDPTAVTSIPDLNSKTLAEAENAVRSWAVEHGFPAACIPPRPLPEELTGQRALSFLTGLAAVVRYVAENIEPRGRMKHVIARLRIRDDDALGEIVELDFALTELLESLAVVAGAAGELRQMLAAVRENDGGFVGLPQLERDAGVIHAALEQILAAYREVGATVEGWLVETRTPLS